MGWNAVGVSLRARAWFVLSSRELAGRLRQFQTTALPARAHFAVRTGRGESFLLSDRAHAGARLGARTGLVGICPWRDHNAGLLRDHGTLSEHAFLVCLAGIEPY